MLRNRTAKLQITEKSCVCHNLFFAKKQTNRNTFKVELFSQLIFQIIFVRLFNVIRKIAKKRKRRNRSRQLSDVFYFDGVTSHNRRVISLNSFQNRFIQFGSTDPFLAILIYFKSCFDDLKNSRFFFCRNEQDGHIAEGSQPPL